MNEETSAYLLLKAAQQLYAKAPAQLSSEQRRRVGEVAVRQQAIERRILASAEAAAVHVPEQAMAHALAEIAARYASADEFQADLQRNALDERTLRQALHRDLRVEAVLDRVAGRSATVSDTDVEIFYLSNLERFRRPETRRLSQILITANEDLAGSERPAAQAKIRSIRERLEKSPERFAEQALKHSECPTAMHGGHLGEVMRGTLYAELEAAAFALPAQGISEILESPLGFHILRCDEIARERVLPLREVRDRIREHLEMSRRHVCQKTWIGQLFRQTA